MGGGSTANGVVTVTLLMLFLAMQLTLASPSRTRKSSVEEVSHSDIIFIMASLVILASVTLLIRHSMEGRGFPVFNMKLITLEVLVGFLSTSCREKV